MSVLKVGQRFNVYNVVADGGFNPNYVGSSGIELYRGVYGPYILIKGTINEIYYRDTDEVSEIECVKTGTLVITKIKKHEK